MKIRSPMALDAGNSSPKRTIWFILPAACAMVYCIMIYLNEDLQYQLLSNREPAQQVLRAATTATTIIKKEEEHSTYELARRESLGFFTDIPEETWKRHKKRFQLTQPNYDDSNQRAFERQSRYSNHFWAGHFEPEFTCPHEFRLGKLGDGGKWICDPHRITQTNKDGKCLIYSIGSNGNYQFEKEAFNHVSKTCEIHKTSTD